MVSIHSDKNYLSLSLLMLFITRLVLNPLHLIFPFGFHGSGAEFPAPFEMPFHHADTICPVCFLVQLFHKYFLLFALFSTPLLFFQYENKLWTEFTPLAPQWSGGSFRTRSPPVGSSL